MFPPLSASTELPIAEGPVNLEMFPGVPLPVTVCALEPSADKPNMMNRVKKRFMVSLLYIFRLSNVDLVRCNCPKLLPIAMRSHFY